MTTAFVVSWSQTCRKPNHVFCLMRDKISILSRLLCNEPQPLQGPPVLRAGGQQVDAGGLHGAVAQHVRQLRHVAARPVKGPR